jgi:hypothetical protein
MVTGRERSSANRDDDLKPLTVLIVVAVSALLILAAAGSAANPPSVPGALPGFAYRYGDTYHGWPLAPVDQQHPLRVSFLDPREPSEQGNYHIGIDISARDDQPEPGAPAGRSHRVYAIEGGVAVVPAGQAAVGCVNRLVTVGHFQYWHTDTIGTITNGASISPGQQIGWTCKGLWHVHLSEIQTVDGVETYVNPLHAGMKLEPYVDTAAPTIHAIRFFTPAFAGWQITNNTRWAPQAGQRLAPTNLHGFVDVRAWIDDPQSFRGFFAELPELYVDLNPYRVSIRLTRLATGRVVLDQEVFRADAFLEAGLPRRALPVIFDYHYAPGTRENTPAIECENHQYVSPANPSCQGVSWFRLFARSNGADWDTTRFPYGRYRLAVTAWDTAGNRSQAGVTVAVRNS